MTKSLIGRCLKKFFWNVYDHLGSLVLLNLLWLLLSLPWIIVTGFLFFVSSNLAQQKQFLLSFTAILMAVQLLFVSPPTVALFAVTRKYVEYKPASLLEIFGALKHFFLPSQGLGILYLLFTVIVTVSISFYKHLGGLFGLSLFGLMSWIEMLVFGTMIFALPLLVAREAGIWTTFKQSLLLILDNLLFSLVLFLIVLLLVAFGIFTGAGIIFLITSLISILLNTALRELLRKYSTNEVSVGEDEEEKRGFRDLLKPWE